MRYIPKKMISKSRFKNHVKTLTEVEYDITISNIERLIDENKEYTDK